MNCSLHNIYCPKFSQFLVLTLTNHESRYRNAKQENPMVYLSTDTYCSTNIFLPELQEAKHIYSQLPFWLSASKLWVILGSIYFVPWLYHQPFTRANPSASQIIALEPYHTMTSWIILIITWLRTRQKWVCSGGSTAILPCEDR